ncbi:terpene cyclase/mutase family protein [Blastopirellula sp. JC732]|uniref:Terpene cyclase/mutase family protein n=1 Tax=Blastopirellula sediminis TaxID=2894196 RepID=A0A9X1MGX5_9BACT|nr:prenyltransferase/squalene oxidase repeat-containing protein [Blastopirellula sediminis]MCC9604279.1 terpene cyclase/mutase family protein [Blastopirellula sediminis]MCC9626799.1 terpene cyclase/mutase family protein [Blastopirellula sediminis]
MNLLIVVSLLVAAPSADSPSEAPAESVRDAVTRSVPFLEREGQAWIDNRKCASCHQVPFMVWSLNEAHRAGAEVDLKKLNETIAWSTDWQNWSASKNRDETKQEQAKSGNIDTMYQLLLGRNYAANEADDSPAEWVETFETALATRQQEDGSWTACGQLPLQNRPERETNEVSTMWTLLALHPRSGELPNWNEKLDAAKKYLQEAQPGQSSEWWALRMMFEQRFGSLETATELKQELLSKQREDGGWGWLVEKPSDALGTGIVLFALSHDRQEADAAVESARQFLLDTQKEDGSWIVPSTLKRANGKVKDTSTYWGTAWAVIGLARTQPTN